MADLDNGEGLPRMPSDEEIKQYVKDLRLKQQTYALRAGGDDDEGARLSELMTDGLKLTKILLEEKKGSFWKDVAKYGEYLGKAFSAGGAVIGFISFLRKVGEPSDIEKIMKAMEEIKEELKKIETAIQQGFAEVIEHMDFVQFREEVTIPVRAMYDLYLRCYTVRGTIPVEDFKKQCKEIKSPRTVFSALYEFLDAKKNIFASHLKSKKYVYSISDEWSTAMYNYATQLVIMNMFYYGIVCEEAAQSGNEKPINEDDELSDLISQLVRMAKRLIQIEEERQKTFHSEGHAKHFLKEHFKKIDFPHGTWKKPLPTDILAKVAFRMKESWKDFNGPEDYYIMVVRGEYGNTSYGTRTYAGWINNDPTRVTVVENIGRCSDSSDDWMCLALIQPVTPEMREANKKANKEHSGLMKDVVEHARPKANLLADQVLGKIKGHFDNFPAKPLLVMYNGGTYRMNHRVDIRDNSIHTLRYNYELTSEAWLSKGGPFPLKFDWRYDQQSEFIDFHEVQMVFQ